MCGMDCWTCRMLPNRPEPWTPLQEPRHLLSHCSSGSSLHAQLMWGTFCKTGGGGGGGTYLWGCYWHALVCAVPALVCESPPVFIYASLIHTQLCACSPSFVLVLADPHWSSFVVLVCAAPAIIHASFICTHLCVHLPSFMFVLTDPCWSLLVVLVHAAPTVVHTYLPRLYPPVCTLVLALVHVCTCQPLVVVICAVPAIVQAHHHLCSLGYTTCTVTISISILICAYLSIFWLCCVLCVKST